MLVLHSWWGLTPSFTAYADRLAEAGFLAGCVDLYDGEVARAAVEARALRARPRKVPMYRTLLAAIEALRCHPAAIAGTVALVGFSMGGHWAMWLAQREEARTSAVVLHHATRSVRPGSAPVPVLAHYADASDPFVTPSGRRAMERSLARAGWLYEAVEHPGAGHWFAESAEDEYDPEAAEAAFARTVAFLDAGFGADGVRT